jgi:hypothetical protein
MYRRGLIAIILACLSGGLLGCGKGVPPAEERPGVKQRQKMQKEKQQQKYMTPEGGPEGSGPGGP